MRMAIICQGKSKNCLVAISYSAQKSAKIVRDSQLTVGSVSEVREPIHSKICLGEDQIDPIFQTHQATIFINNVIYEDFPPIPMVSQPIISAVFRYSFWHAKTIFPARSGLRCKHQVPKRKFFRLHAKEFRLLLDSRCTYQFLRCGK